MIEMSEDDLLEKLERKYERPRPGLCRVCNSQMEIAHKGGGLPLKWVCEKTKLALAAGETPELLEHLEASIWLDYRAVGDARVMRLLSLYKDLKQRLMLQQGPTQAPDAQVDAQKQPIHADCITAEA